MSEFHGHAPTSHFNRKHFFLTHGFAKIEKANGRCLEGIEHAVKCPKCGFVAFPGLSQCEKCGHHFVSSPREEGPSLFSAPSTSSPEPATPAIPISHPPGPELPGGSNVTLGELPQGGSALGTIDSSPLLEKAPELTPVRPWREELSERVEKFRRRRAGLRRVFDPTTASFDLEFETSGGGETDQPASDQLIEFPQGDREIDLVGGGLPIPEGKRPALESLPLGETTNGSQLLGSAAVEAGEWPLEHRESEPEPVEIVLESSQGLAQAAASESASLLGDLAPLGLRFLAGVVDALVLLLALGLFALIFWRAGGRVSPQPANLVVLAFIAVFFILLYFGLFTAVTSSTLGLVWMGLEVRNLDGTLPTTRESLWRALGYMVSINALMLGFIWALVDADGLTWHDRMSGTFVAVANTKHTLDPQPGVWN